jgi:MarR family transcriptional regulator, lower aerobic nicotinate degradation pathway regulator
MSTTEELNRPVHPRVAKELIQSSGFLLARLGLRFKASAIDLAEEAGFELYDYSVLAILAEGARETQSTIAEALNLDPSRLVAMLDRLEGKGLISRQRDPLDRRRHVVSITAAGKRELTRLRELIHGLESEFLAPLTEQDRKALHALLLKLAEANDPGCAFQGTTAA